MTADEDAALQAVFEAEAPAEKLGGKTQWLWGETIDFTGGSLSYETYYNKVRIAAASTMQIDKGSYTVAHEKYVKEYEQYNVIFRKESGGNYLHIKPLDYDAETIKEPIGIQYVSGEGTKASPYLFELIYDETPVTYTITVTDDGHGTATADKSSGATGTEVTLTATAKSGYQFREWQVISGGVTVMENKFTIGTENVEVKAIFATNDKVVSSKEVLGKESKVYAGEIIVDGTSQMTYLYSADISNNASVFDNLRASLAGTAFDGLVPAITGESEAVGLAVSSAHRDEMNGSWTNAAAVAGQYFTGTVGTETSGNFYDENAAYKTKVDAHYAERKDTYDNPLAFNKSIGSALNTTTDFVWVNQDGVLVKEYTVTAAVEETTVIYTTVHVTSAPAAYAVTVNPAANGSVSVDKASAAVGETVTITATPDSGYELATLTVTDAGGGSVTVTDNQFTMPASNVTVTATFKETTRYLCLGTTVGGSYDVRIGADPERTGMTDSINMTGSKGDTVALTAAPDSGYAFKGWYQGVRGTSGFVESHNGTLISSSAEYSFPLNENTDLQAVFEPISEDNLYYTASGEGQDHVIASGLDGTFTVKRSVEDENTFSRFIGIQVDDADVDRSNYEASAGSVVIRLRAAYLDTLSVGAHTMNVRFTDGSVRIGFTVSRRLSPNRFEDVAVASDTFSFKKVWEGGSESSIDFTLYKLGGTVYRHTPNKRVISRTEWQYNAWFSEAVACYVIEQPVPGYKTRYENVGVYAGITDRCCDGGTIVNYKVPQTGDDAPLILWLGCALAGLTLVSLAVFAGKRKKAHR